MPLRRRRLLTLLAAGTAGAGCRGLPADQTTPTDEPAATGTPPSAAAVGCPPYERSDPDRVVCSTDPPGDTLVLEPRPGTAELPTATVDCRLENTLDEPFETNFYDWKLHRYADGAWHYLGPYAVPMPLHRLQPGATHVRRLHVDNTDLERVAFPTPAETATEAGEGSVRTAGRHGLGPGAYAVAIRSSTEGPETMYAAAFTLRGDPVPLVAPATVTDTRRDGDHVEVRVEARHEEPERHDLTVTRTGDPSREPEPLIDEQLYHPRFAGLRAAFAGFEDGVSSVTVRGDDSGISRNLASGSAPRTVAYDGATYELRLGGPADGADAGDLDLSGGWRQFAANPRNTGHLDTAAPADPTEAWRFEAAGRLYDGPTVAGDLVLVPSTDGNVYAVTAADGEEVWRFAVRGQARTTPAVADGRVYAAGRDGGVHALDPRTGEPEWTFTGGEGYVISHPTVADGTVYIGDDAGTLFAIDAATGEERWARDLGDDIASSPAVDDGSVFVGWRGDTRTSGARAGGLTALSTDGRHQWTLEAGKVDGSPTVADGTVYAGSANGLLAVDATEGDRRWTFERNALSASPALADGTVYVGTREGNLHALDPSSGESRWYFPTDKWATTAPAVADGLVVCTSWDDHVYGVDAANGTERWAHELATPISGPAVHDGTVYVASNRSLVALRDR
jgi:outer membrane protein assembly factor BamB